MRTLSITEHSFHGIDTSRQEPQRQASPMWPVQIIEALGLTVTRAAEVLGVTRAAALSAVLTERAHVSPEMALRIEKAFGVSTAR